MSFRTRLALFLAVTLVAVQALTAAVAYLYLRHNLIQRGKHELAAEVGVFTRQLDFLSERVTDAVKVSSLDYALRAAIAQHNSETELSALRNHSRRIGATRMIVVGLDGALEMDTATPHNEVRRFRFPELLGTAAVNDKAAALVTVDRHIYWLVVVPVRAPVPIGFIAAFLPVNDSLLARLRALSAEPREIVLSVGERAGQWRPAARSGANGLIDPSSLIPDDERAFGAETVQNGHHFLTAVSRLETPKGSQPIAAVISYPLDEALGAYQSLLFPLLFLLALALLGAVGGTMVVVRGLSRPLEELAAAARRIASGDYTAPPKLPQRDEVGHLSDALNHMALSIADREAALRHAAKSAEAAREHAVQANDAKSHFLANMSHELRTPLNAILGFSEMIEHQVIGPLNDRYVVYAQDIRASAGNLLHLVERMLDVADSESSQLTLSRTEIHPLQLLEEAAAELKHFAREKGVRLLADLPPVAEVKMLGDPARLKQAFTNIVHNAIKFTPTGGEVRVSSCAEGDLLSIRVADNGIGIAPEALRDVMRPFHRLRSALDGRQQGAGLGLPLARAIVELHGGHLELTSEAGRGTTAKLVLPVLVSAVSWAA